MKNWSLIFSVFLKSLFKTAQDLFRLEKVEIGGIKGKALSTLVVKIFEEFREEFEKFGNQKYDVLDPGSDVEKMTYLID
jgi:dynein heavy chain